MGAGTLLLASLICAAGAQPATEIWMKSRAINIPIQINPDRRHEIRELLLFVSTDKGRSWSQEGRATPEKTFFPFYAPQEGEYWFSICMIDVQGKREPQDVNSSPPGLVIKIDTRPPVVQFRSVERSGDDVTVVWGVEEENPDPATLKLEYRPANDDSATWTAVPINSAPTGQAKFRAATSGPVMVKMSFQDLAGNQAQAVKKLSAEPIVGTTSANGPSNPGLVDPTPAAPAGPVPPIVPIRPDFAVGASAPAPPAPPPPAPHIDPPAPNLAPIASSTNSGGAPPRDQFTAQRDPLAGSVASTNPVAPRAEMRNTQLLNCKQITLEYGVVRAGPSGVRRAILYLTDNDGQSWQEIARDELGTRKVTATLPGEGTFGFRIVLESHAGLSKGPPQQGDQPEIRVEVDLTPPEVTLYPLAPDPNRRDTLIFRWQAADKNLGPNPIDLEYSEKEDGQWTKIATVPNTGTYGWRLPQQMPVRVFLRVVARDLAGNIGEARTGQPQLIDLYKPEGELKGITGTTVQLRP